MNSPTNTIPRASQPKRRRFCDRFGATWLICLGLFFAFVKLLQHAGKL